MVPNLPDGGWLSVFYQRLVLTREKATLNRLVPITTPSCQKKFNQCLRVAIVRAFIPTLRDVFTQKFDDEEKTFIHETGEVLKILVNFYNALKGYYLYIQDKPLVVEDDALTEQEMKLLLSEVYKERCDRCMVEMGSNAASDLKHTIPSRLESVLTMCGTAIKGVEMNTDIIAEIYHAYFDVLDILSELYFTYLKYLNEQSS